MQTHILALLLSLIAATRFFDKREHEADEIRQVRRVQYADVRPKINLEKDSPDFGILLTKPMVWSYEEEWRYLLPLDKANKVVHASPFDIHLFQVPWDAVTAVILGHRMNEAGVKAIADLVSGSSSLAHVSVLVAQMHPTDFALNIVPFTSYEDMSIDAIEVAAAQEKLSKMSDQANKMNAAIPAKWNQELIEHLRNIK